MNPLAIRLLPVAFLAVFATGQAPGPRSPALDDLLPSSTYACLQFGGTAACRGAIQASPLAPVVDELWRALPPDLRADRVERGVQRAADRLRDRLQERGVRPADLRAVLARPMALALGRLSIEGMGPSLTLVVDAGPEAAALQRLVEVALQLLAEHGAVHAEQAIEIDGVAFRQIRFDHGPTLFHGAIGGHQVLGNSRGYLREMLAVAAGQTKALGKAVQMPSRHLDLPVAPLAALLLHTAPLCSMLEPHLPYEAADFADALGLGRLDLVYAAAAADANGGADVLHIGVGGSAHGICKALSAQPVDLGFAAACSPDTVLFAAGSLDVPAVIDAFDRLLTMLPGGLGVEVRREVLRDLGRDLRRMGSSPQQLDHVLRGFGGQVGLAVALDKGAVPKPELLVHVAVAEPGTVAALLQRAEALLARRVATEWRERDVDGSAIRYCSLSIEDALQLTPCYALRDDGLWIGSDVAGLVRALKRKAGEAPSLAAEADFHELQAAGRGASGVLHERLFRAVQIGWPAVESWVFPWIDRNSDRLGFDSDALPDSESLAAALGCCSLVCRVDDAGMTLRSRGPATFGSLLALGGWLADEMLRRTCVQVF